MRSTNLRYLTWRHYLLCLLFLLLLAAASCNKEKNNPRHRDVVTATINGKAWEARCKETPPFGCNIGYLQYYSASGGLSLIAGDGIEGGNIRIRLVEVFKPGIYKMRHQTQCSIRDKGEPCGIQGHYIDENDPQEIEIISIDNENRIVEGRFHFIGHDTNCLSEPLHITDGYFKMQHRN